MRCTDNRQTRRASHGVFLFRRNGGHTSRANLCYGIQKEGERERKKIKILLPVLQNDGRPTESNSETRKRLLAITWLFFSSG